MCLTVPIRFPMYFGFPEPPVFGVMPVPPEYAAPRPPVLSEPASFCVWYKSITHPDISVSLPHTAQLNGFNCLLRDEIGFWTNLVKSKMPASRFLIQTDEFEFEELVRTSTLLCFSSSKTPGSEQTLKGRKRIPLTDPEVNVTYHLISSAKSTILQSVSPTFEFRYQK